MRLRRQRRMNLALAALVPIAITAGFVFASPGRRPELVAIVLVLYLLFRLHLLPTWWVCPQCAKRMIDKDNEAGRHLLLGYGLKTTCDHCGFDFAHSEEAT